MSRTFRRNNTNNDLPDKDRWTKNKAKRDIGQNKRIKKDYLKNKDYEDE